MTKQADLTAYVFDGQPHPLSGELMQWMEASARFTAFIDTYRDKVRKKIRTTREPESILDVRGELEVAYCLLTDRRLSVAYEPYISAKRRGPDFAVTYRANLVFNIEVTRMREDERVQQILLDKLGQMQPGMANLLVIQPRADLAQAIGLERLMQAVKTRAEGKDPAFYAAGRYTSPAAFYKDFLHLSGILLWAASPQLWANRQARPPLDEKVMRLMALLASGADRGE